MEFRVEGYRFRVQCLWFRVQNLWSRVKGSWFSIQLGLIASECLRLRPDVCQPRQHGSLKRLFQFMVWDSGFRDYGFGVRVQVLGFRV